MKGEEPEFNHVEQSVESDGTASSSFASSRESDEPDPRPGHPRKTATMLNSLNVRIAALLTFALLPLGIVEILQTQRAADAAREVFRASLVAQTLRAATPEREAIISAFGLAEGLADALIALDPGREECSAMMREAAVGGRGISFIGLVERGGLSVCNNLGRDYDFSDNPASPSLFAEPRQDVRFSPAGDASGLPVIIVSEPVRDDDGTFVGYVSLSFQGSELAASRRAQTAQEELWLLTFNAAGEILTSDTPDDGIASYMPAGLRLSDLSDFSGTVFSGETAYGEKREFAVVPIVDNRAYALGSWRMTMPGDRPAWLSPTTYLPLAMWILSLCIAIVVFQRQVVRPVRTLMMRMRNFADGRAIFRANTLETAPQELHEIGLTFERLSEQIAHDEAVLEDRVHERELLLREVHHRVKNNLQMMSSIINIQARQTTDEGAGEALRSVQGRLASLARYHQDLYETSSLSRLSIDQLLEELTRQMLGIGAASSQHVDLKFDLHEVLLSPDQASPLAMLATEALTNALKYASAADDVMPYVRVSLRCDHEGGEDVVTLGVENSIDPGKAQPEGPGLGVRLMKAFGSQLEASMETERLDGLYRLTIRFVRQRFPPGTENGTPAQS